MISGSIGISLNPNHNFQQDSIDKLKDILQKWFEEDGEDADFRFDKNEFLLEAGFAFFGHGDLFWDWLEIQMKKEDNAEKKLGENLSEILINSQIIGYSYEVESNRYMDKVVKEAKEKVFKRFINKKFETSLVEVFEEFSVFELKLYESKEVGCVNIKLREISTNSGKILHLYSLQGCYLLIDIEKREQIFFSGYDAEYNSINEILDAIENGDIDDDSNYDWIAEGEIMYEMIGYEDKFYEPYK